MSASPDVDAYIARFEDPVRGRLQALRAAIGEEAPDATERISYGMPTWTARVNLVHMAAYARHIGIYPGPAAIEAFQEELSGFRTSKGAIQLPHDRDLPLDLVRRLVRWQVARYRKSAD